jgi:transposase
MIDRNGNVVGRGVVTTSRPGFGKQFERMPKARVVIENGTHARWVWRLFVDWGHEVIVANTHKVKLISHNDRKHDRIDAEYLARLGRMDPQLLSPIRFRGEQAHADRSVLKARDGLVRARSMLISEVRGMVKTQGSRICDYSAESFARKAAEQIPAILLQAVKPVLASIEQLSEKIRSYDQQIEQISQERYPETELLQQVTGVGPITSLAFLVTLEDASRFGKSRHVGPYLGLTPKRDQSGDHDAQLRITKAGDGYLRKLLVNGAQYILGPFGPDCDLRRHGLKIAARGGKNAKKRAVIAVARKLAVLLHHLWVTGECYEPLYNSQDKSFSSGRSDDGASSRTGQVPAGLLHCVTPLRVTAATAGATERR